MTALNQVVQESSKHTLVFTTKDFIPGFDLTGVDSNIESAIHIKFPNTFTLQEITTDPVPIELSGTSISLDGDVTRTQD